VNHVLAAPSGFILSELSFRGSFSPPKKDQSGVTHGGRPMATGSSPASGPASPQPMAPLAALAPPKFCFPSATDTFTYNTPTPNGFKKEGTKVQSLMGGGQVFQKINETLDKAKSWVMVDMYELQSPAIYPERVSPPGTPGADAQGKIVQKLVDLKNKNIKVRVILDHSKQVVRPPHTLEPDHNARVLEFLRKNGIETVTYPRDVSKINHTKLVLVDNKYAVVSGMNWGNHSPTNHDGGVSIEGPDARNLFHQLFKPDWLTSGGDASLLPPITPFHPGKIQVLQTSGAKSVQGPKSEILEAILKQIDQAKESIHAELFVLTSKQVVESLIQKHAHLKAAGKEGVKILVDPGLFFSFPNCRPGIQKLAKAGVPIRFLENDRAKEEKLHAKWAVFDRKTVLMGSANWSGVGLEHKGTGWVSSSESSEASEDEISRPGAQGNHEMDVLIQDAPNVAGTFARQAAYDYQHHSFPIMEKGMDGKWSPIKVASHQAAASP
jgi:hypothetical protein